MPEDPFDLLGLPARYEIDPAELDRHYLDRAGALDPASAGDAGTTWATLNDARSALADPEKRANLLLARLGGPRPDEEKSLPPAFLADMMEVRENVEAALATGLPADRDLWRTWAAKRRRELIAQLTADFASLPPHPGPAPLRQIRITLNSWRYIERLVEQLEV